MRIRKAITLALSCALLFSTIDVYGQNTPPQNWDTLKTIPMGEKIEVLDKNGKKRKGNFKDASDLSLELERKGKFFSYKPDEVRSVWRFTTRKRIGLGVLIGAAAGLGAAVGVGTAVAFAVGDSDDPGAGFWVVLISLLTFPIIGGVLGAKASEDRFLVYTAP